MAYFSLPPLTLPSYRFDYHSHFGGILPVDAPDKVVKDAALVLNVAYAVQGQDGTFKKDTTITVGVGQQLSLVGLFGGAADNLQADRGTLSLFVKALMLMEESNPLAAVAGSANRSRYERGECIAEDIYIACTYLAQQLGVPDVHGAVATDPVFYKTVRRALEAAVRPGTRDAPPPIETLMPSLRYFNDKIYSASKYTPFDDAYRARSFALKKLRGERGGEELYLQWMAMSFLYLEQEGIAHAQLAMGDDEIRLANAIAAAYNASRSTQYKLLAHTSSVYSGDKALENELNKKILPLFLDPSLTELIGIDLLGSENKVGNYTELFAFLAAQQPPAQPAEPPAPYLTQYFGPNKPRALQLINHIHCGEGMGVSADNRSAIGYAMAYSSHLPGPEFYRAYADYVLACVVATQGRRVDNTRGTAGIPGAGPISKKPVAGLFDEMFRNDSLTVGGLTLRRYDGNSARTRDLVAYSGKRNMMALCESLDQSSAPPPPPPLELPPDQAPQLPADPGDPVAPAPSYYQLLTAPGSLIGFRLGHAYYYRSFVAARYPLIAFDTNLGSNSITGASGLFGSVEGYRLNRGFRHLDGYVDTDLLKAVTDLVMFTGLQALNEAQVAALMSLARSSSSLADLLEQGENTLSGLINAAIEPIASAMDSASSYDSFKKLVIAMVGANTSPSVWFAALSRVLNLFINWRSYLLGSDAQGVEHTDVQDEFLRSVLLLAYNLAPFDTNERSAAEVGQQLQGLVIAISAAYWKTTVGPLATNPGAQPITATIAGYKAPASVVTVTRQRAPA